MYTPHRASPRNSVPLPITSLRTRTLNELIDSGNSVVRFPPLKPVKSRRRYWGTVPASPGVGERQSPRYATTQHGAMAAFPSKMLKPVV